MLKPFFDGTSKLLDEKLENYWNVLKKISQSSNISIDTLIANQDFFNNFERFFLTPLLFFFPTNIRISKIECEVFEVDSNQFFDFQKVNQKFLSSTFKITHRYPSLK